MNHRKTSEVRRSPLQPARQIATLATIAALLFVVISLIFPLSLDAQWANYGVQAIYCLATIVLAVAAVRPDWVRHTFAQPRLGLEIPAKFGVLTYFEKDRPVWYFHLTVKNHRRSVNARRAFVRCHTVDFRDEAGNWKYGDWPAPIPFEWVWGKAAGTNKDGIQIRDEYAFDLARIIKPRACYGLSWG